MGQHCLLLLIFDDFEGESHHEYILNKMCNRQWENGVGNYYGFPV